MNALLWLIPLALILGGVGLWAFFWTVRSGQYDDPQGDAGRFLYAEDRPIIDLSKEDKP